MHCQRTAPKSLNGSPPLVWPLIAGTACARDPQSEVVPQLDADRYDRALIYLTVPIHYPILIYVVWVVGTWHLPGHAVLARLYLWKFVNGLAINTGPELGHKWRTSERWCAKNVAAGLGYGHFIIDHNIRNDHCGAAT